MLRCRCMQHEQILTAILFAELVEMLVWERDKIMSDGPGRNLSDLNLGDDESSSAVLQVRLHTISRCSSSVPLVSFSHARFRPGLICRKKEKWRT